MAKKAAKTFHPLAMAKSLEAQNEAVGFVLAKLNTVASLAPSLRNDPDKLVQMILDLASEGEAARKLLWPEGED